MAVKLCWLRLLFLGTKTLELRSFATHVRGFVALTESKLQSWHAEGLKVMWLALEKAESLAAGVLRR